MYQKRVKIDGLHRYLLRQVRVLGQQKLQTPNGQIEDIPKLQYCTNLVFPQNFLATFKMSFALGNFRKCSANVECHICQNKTFQHLPGELSNLARCFLLSLFFFANNESWEQLFYCFLLDVFESQSTVDGKNPAPVGRQCIPLLMQGFIHPRSISIAVLTYIDVSESQSISRVKSHLFIDALIQLICP